MTREASLTLKEGYVDVTVKNEKVNSSKSISYDSLAEVFEKRGDMVSPFLPGEFGLQKYVISGNREYYLYTEQPKIVTCKYSVSRGRRYEPDPGDYEDGTDDPEYEDAVERYEAEEGTSGDDGMNINKFTAPILVYFVSLTKHSNGKYAVNDTLMYALKTPIYTGKEELFEAPFSNIYEQGRICWGHNAISIPTLKAIQGISTLFFGSPFNTDLEGGRFDRFRRTYVDGNASLTLHFQMETDAMLKDPEKTPDDVLKFVHSHMTESGTTVEQRFRNFTRGN